MTEQSAIWMTIPMTLSLKLQGPGPRQPHDHHAASCSPEAAKRSHKGHRKPQREEAFQAKERSCLMCGSQFQSAWPGERICKRCKESATWRSG